MKKTSTTACIAIIASLLLSSCATRQLSDLYCTDNLGEVGYVLADAMRKSVPPEDIDRTIIVGSIVNLDDINDVSPLGRLVGEHISSRMAQFGLRVTEPRLRNILVITQAGEHVLSREAKDLATKSNAHAFITGTVTKMHGRYYFNARLVRAKDSQILGSHDICLSGKVRGAGL